MRRTDMSFMSFTNYNPKSHPCYQCKERNAECHGHCERERIFNENKPKRPQNVFSESGNAKISFHKKGRIITK